MSEVFASSAEKDTIAASTTATPPYSSEGPTLPLIAGDGEHATDAGGTILEAKARGTNGEPSKRTDKRVHGREGPAAPNNTSHPGLYEPWTLLPREITGPLLSQSRLADAQNVVPIVFTKNQNVKAGVVRLKTYLGAPCDQKNPLEIPELLKEKCSVIAVSSQGEGTAKLVTIVDMVKRVVKPNPALPTDDKLVQTWWMYMSLTSVDVEQEKRIKRKADTTQESQEEEAFEPMEIDVPFQKMEETKLTRKVPVLTVWMSKNEIPAFKEAFGEQTFAVQALSKDD